MDKADLSSQSYLVKLHTIRTFIFDFDGVLTDGSLLIMPDNPDGSPNWYRKMYARDGYAIHQAIKMKYNIVIVSGGVPSPAEDRLRKLGVEDVYFNIRDKDKFINDFMPAKNWSFDSSLYMGDDIPDLKTMKRCSIAACPQDACDEVLAIANYISTYKGGNGCVRDVIRMVMKLQGTWE